MELSHRHVAKITLLALNSLTQLGNVLETKLMTQITRSEVVLSRKKSVELSKILLWELTHKIT